MFDFSAEHVINLIQSVQEIVKQSVRSCIVCRKKDSKFKLDRYVFSLGALVYDPRKIIQSRGAYAHPECFKALFNLKPKQVEYSFKLPSGTLSAAGFFGRVVVKGKELG